MDKGVDEVDGYNEREKKTHDDDNVDDKIKLCMKKIADGWGTRGARGCIYQMKKKRRDRKSCRDSGSWQERRGQLVRVEITV